MRVAARGFNRWIGPQHRGRYRISVVKKEGTRERTRGTTEEDTQNGRYSEIQGRVQVLLAYMLRAGQIGKIKAKVKAKAKTTIVQLTAWLTGCMGRTHNDAWEVGIPFLVLVLVIVDTKAFYTQKLGFWAYVPRFVPESPRMWFLCKRRGRHVTCSFLSLSSVSPPAFPLNPFGWFKEPTVFNYTHPPLPVPMKLR